MLIGQKELYKQVPTFTDAIYVEAPAGCGKTYSCIKCVDILTKDKKLKSYQKVLILTFSKNARAQILNELSKYNKSELLYKHIEVSNYHSFYKRYLDKYRDIIGFKKELSIVDDDEYKDFFKLGQKDNIAFGDCYKLNGKYYYSNNNKEVIDLKTKKQYERLYDLSRDTGIITFNMFGILINELFDKSPKLVELIAHDYPYLFLDEYQDTDNLQEYFLIRLFSHSKCIFFADPIQMIYSFKGASEERLTKLKEFFPDMCEIKFEENFRYKDKQDIVSILDSIRNDENFNYDNLVNGKVFDVKVKLDNISQLQSQYGKNILPSNVYYSILNTNIVQDAIKLNKSVCILVKTNDMVNKLCLKFDENHIKANEISDSKYMLKLNIITKKYFFTTNEDEIIKFALQIYALCKYNRKIEDETFEKLEEITSLKFFRKRKDEFVQIKKYLQRYNLKQLDIIQKQELLSLIVNIIQKNSINYSAYNFITHIISLKSISEKDIDNVYTYRQFLSSNSQIKPGLYVANYYQCKGREFDYVIVIMEPGMDNIAKYRNILYVTHSRMKEKLFIGKFTFVVK